MGTAVQFYGIGEVMEAAENRQCAVWGIWIDGKLFSKFQDSDFSASMDMLHKNLEVLERSGTEGRYTLKFFENDTDKPLKINERSVCDGGSFTFKLTDPQQREQRSIGYANTTVLEQKVAALEKRLAQPEEEETVHTIIRDILKDPDQLQQYVNIGRTIFGMPVQSFGNGIGKVHRALPDVQETPVENKEELLQRAGDAIDELEKHDPKLVEHLEKLATMARNDPEGFNRTIGLIDLI